MKIQVSRVELSAQEEVQVCRPEGLGLQYRTLARGLALLGLVPGTLGVMAALFLVPARLGVVPVLLACSFLHVVLLMGLLSLASALERPLSRVLWHVAWPMHRWWMVRSSSERLCLKAQRRLIQEHQAETLELDLEQGILRTREQCLNLLRPCSVELEQGAGQQPQLRLRLRPRGQARPLVLSATLPYSLYWRCRQQVEALPRLEAGAVVMDWESFERLTGQLRPFLEASGATWPALLRQLSPAPTRAQNEPTYQRLAA